MVALNDLTWGRHSKPRRNEMFTKLFSFQLMRASRDTSGAVTAKNWRESNTHSLHWRYFVPSGFVFGWVKPPL